MSIRQGATLILVLLVFVVAPQMLVSATLTTCLTHDHPYYLYQLVATNPDCVEGPGDSGPPPCTTDCPPRWMSIEVNGMTGVETTMPITRFNSLLVDRSDADGVTALSPIPYAHERDVLTPLQAITEGDITTAMAYFGLQDGALMASSIDGILRHEPALQEVREATLDLLAAGRYLDAARTLLDEYTPANVTLSCGPDSAPLSLSWVIGIPVMVPCSEGNFPKKIPLWLSAAEPQAIASEFLVDKNSPFMLDSATLTLRAHAATDATRSLVGFTWFRHGFGMNTTTGKEWNVTVAFSRIAYAAGDEAKSTFATASTTSFSSGDRGMYTYGGNLSRGLTLGPVLARSTAMLRMNVTMLRGDHSESPSWKLQFVMDHRDTDVVSHLRGVADWQSREKSIAFQVGRYHRIQLRHDRILSPGGTLYSLDVERPDSQPRDIASDQVELKATMHSGRAPFATMQIAGLPNRAYLLFDDGRDAGDGVFRLDAARDPLESSEVREDGGVTNGYFRSVLMTIHLPSLPYSVSADYTYRTFLQGGEGHDPVANAPGPWLLQSGWSTRPWGEIVATRTSGGTDNDYVNLTYNESQAAWEYRLRPPKLQSTPLPVPDNVIVPVEGTPSSPARYLWGYPETALATLPYPCPIRAANNEECR